MTRLAVVLAVNAAMALGAAATGHAQASADAITARVNAVRNGTVRLSFAARTGVCGDGNNWIRTRTGSRIGTFNSSRDIETTCDTGPVRVVVERRDGVTTELRTYVGGRWRAATDVTDLGTVSAPAAAQWLVLMAEREDSKPARDAILAATLADSADVWRPLLRIARDESRSREIRNQAVFWVADFAGEKVSASLDSMAYEDGDRDVRRQAIFAISQRPKEESVPLLIRMSETLKDRELRKQAIFWLGQSRDPRAVTWLEQVLTRSKQ